MKRIFITLLLSGGIALSVNAQDFHMPQPSPTASVSQDFSTSYIKIDYSRPSMKGRVIFGTLLPYGSNWRTGANGATKIAFGEDVNIDGHDLKAGSYAIYTIPNKDFWIVIFNKGISNWGPDGLDKKDDLFQIKIPVVRHDEKQETFRISVENITSTSCDIELRWEDISISIPVKADNNKRIMAYLDKALKSKNPPYGQAAAYYLETGQKLNEALEYTDMNIKDNPDAYFLFWRKAQILQKLGQHEQALDAAKQAAELAKKAPAFTQEYQEHYQDLLNEN